jgi:hypothetical protein
MKKIDVFFEDKYIATFEYDALTSHKEEKSYFLMKENSLVAIIPYTYLIIKTTM